MSYGYFVVLKMLQIFKKMNQKLKLVKLQVTLIYPTCPEWTDRLIQSIGGVVLLTAFIRRQSACLLEALTTKPSTPVPHVSVVHSLQCPSDLHRPSTCSWLYLVVHCEEYRTCGPVLR